MADMVAKGRQCRGPRPFARMTKLSIEQVREIRASLTGAWGEASAIARRYGVANSTINQIVHQTRRTEQAMGRAARSYPKLTLEKAREIRAASTGEIGELRRIGNRFGVGKTSVLKILQNKTWKEPAEATV